MSPRRARSVAQHIALSRNIFPELSICAGASEVLHTESQKQNGSLSSWPNPASHDKQRPARKGTKRLINHFFIVVFYSYSEGLSPHPNMPRPTQLTLLGSLRNSELFSSHWLKNRLPLEPEWNEYQTVAAETLKSMTELWQEQRSRVEQYGGDPSARRPAPPVKFERNTPKM